jgi:conjugative transfer pilus assembly protein TraH
VRSLSFQHTGRRLIAVALIAALQASAIVQAADLSQQMAGMFGNGAMSNVTGPGAYRSQTQRIYMGGEMELRLPTRTYQMFSYSMPSIHAGCGGADAYLGSFSHITSDQLKHMLEQVATQYGALLFKTALKSINPLIESVIGDLQKSLESINASNANTCGLAQQLVNATAGPQVGAIGQDACERAAIWYYNEDPAAAKRRCKTDTTSTNNDVKSSGAPGAEQYAQRDVNLVMAALEKSSYSRVEKELFMNVGGTAILYAAAEHQDQPLTPKFLDPSVDSLRTLLFGNAPGNTPDTVKIEGWWTCDNDECLNPTQQTNEVTPFPVLVSQKLQSIRDSILNRTPLTAAQIGFINMTNIPIYRLMSLGNLRDADAKNTEMVDQLIARYSKIIAYDYAYAFLRTSLKDVKLYLHLTPVKDKVEQSNVAVITQNIENMLDQLQVEHGRAAGAIRDMRAVVDDLKDIERDLQTSLPASIRGMRNMSLLIKGRG